MVWGENRSYGREHEVKRNCRYCGKEFYPDFPNSCYCSEECKKKAQKEQRKKYRESRENRGRGNRKKPKPVDKCSKCGFNIHYVLEYSHEVKDFLCPNCHELYELRHPKETGGHPHKGKRLENPNIRIKSLRRLGECFLCGKRRIRGVDIARIQETHHMIPKAWGIYEKEPRNLVLVCPTCHAILTKALGNKSVEKIQGEFTKELNRFFNTSKTPYSSYSDFKKNLGKESLKAIRRFYSWLQGNRWENFLNRIREKQETLG